VGRGAGGVTVGTKASFFAGLQKRHVYKVGAIYGVGGWPPVQVAPHVLPIFDVSALSQRITVLIPHSTCS